MVLVGQISFNYICLKFNKFNCKLPGTNTQPTTAVVSFYTPFPFIQFDFNKTNNTSLLQLLGLAAGYCSTSKMHSRVLNIDPKQSTHTQKKRKQKKMNFTSSVVSRQYKIEVLF